jgi:putative tryptophan/tyrosine transport system substrate-binding protein
MLWLKLMDLDLWRGRMRRRALITTIAAAAALPLAVRGQPAKVPVIGVLIVGLPAGEKFWRLFRDDMRKLGYIDGQSVRYEFRSDQGQIARLPGLAAELVRLKVDLIVTWFTPAAQAAKQATRDIPIVMGFTGDPLAAGLIESLSRPGGNITGISGMASDLSGKCVDLSRELLPQAGRVAALAYTADPFSKAFLDKIQLAGKAAGIAIEPVLIQGIADLEPAFAALEKARPDTVIVQPSLPVRRVTELALKYKLPTLGPVRTLAEDGGLISYAADEADAYRKAVSIVDKVLKGAKPADLPVEQPTKFELVINLRTAKAIGLTIPTPLFQRADDVIE